MENTYFQRQKGFEFKNVQDFWHYPDEVYLRDAGDRIYKLKDYEINNIEQIKKILSHSDFSKNDLNEYLEYLEFMTHDIREILEQEKAEGLSNIKLEQELRQIASLMGQIFCTLDEANNYP